MTGHFLEQEGAVARFVPNGSGPVIEVTERVDRRLLGHNEIARFHTRVPLSNPVEARLLVRHTGRWSRDGIEARVMEGDGPARLLAQTLETEPSLVEGALPLDFTRFEVSATGDDCTATIELMGASFVSVALPPMRNYVRLYADQLDALIRTLTAFGDVVRRFDRSAS
jgi:hypothetical protein